MYNLESEKSPFSKIDHIGILVRDVDKAVEYYESLGIGPFKPVPRIAIDRVVRGKPADDVHHLASIAPMGSVKLELVQPVSGESVQKEFLDKHGEGINHLGFLVDDFEKEVARLVGKGYKVISSAKFAAGGGLAYLDTDRVGGVIFELLQWPPVGS